jgi:hypothetical protein
MTKLLLLITQREADGPPVGEVYESGTCRLWQYGFASTDCLGSQEGTGARPRLCGAIEIEIGHRQVRWRFQRRCLGVVYHPHPVAPFAGDSIVGGFQ